MCIYIYTVYTVYTVTMIIWYILYIYRWYNSTQIDINHPKMDELWTQSITPGNLTEPHANDTKFLQIWAFFWYTTNSIRRKRTFLRWDSCPNWCCASLWKQLPLEDTAPRPEKFMSSPRAQRANLRCKTHAPQWKHPKTIPKWSQNHAQSTALS